MHYTKSDYGRLACDTFPEVYGIRPASLLVRSRPIRVTVSGANFKKGCKGLVDGQPRETVFGSPKTIRVELKKKDLAEVRTLKIRVINPDGEVLGLTSRREPFVTVEIDLNEVALAKQTYPRYIF